MATTMARTIVSNGQSGDGPAAEPVETKDTTTVAVVPFTTTLPDIGAAA